MDGSQLNTSIGFVVAVVGFVSWATVLAIAPHRFPVGAPVMTLLSLGLLAVSTLALIGEPWWVGVVAATNRALVAGSGIRILWLIHREARPARREP